MNNFTQHLEQNVNWSKVFGVVDSLYSDKGFTSNADNFARATMVEKAIDKFSNLDRVDQNGYDFLGNFIWEIVSDGIRIETISATSTEVITLVDIICIRKIVKTEMQNICHFSLMVSINIGMVMIDFDEFFVEDTFCTYEEFIICWITSPNYCWRTINLY